MEYTAERKKDLLPFATSWMELESIMLSKISQSVKDKYHTISPIRVPYQQNKQVSTIKPETWRCLGRGPGPQLGAHERQPHIDVSLPLFLRPFPSL